MIDYPCTEFDDLSFSHFGFIVRTSTQTESEVECRTITMLTQLPSACITISVESYK